MARCNAQLGFWSRIHYIWAQSARSNKRFDPGSHSIHCCCHHRPKISGSVLVDRGKDKNLKSPEKSNNKNHSIMLLLKYFTWYYPVCWHTLKQMGCGSVDDINTILKKIVIFEMNANPSILQVS